MVAFFLPSITLLIINAKKIAHRMNADQVGSHPPRERTVSPTVDARKSPPLNANSFLFTRPAIATKETPIMRVVLAVTEPTALPIASCAEPFIAALTDTRSSGSVVANDTTVAPTTNFGMPVASANQAAESTNQSPPLIIRTRPTIKRPAATAIKPPPLREPNRVKPKNSIFSS